MELQTIEQMMIVDYQGALINWDNAQLIELANDTVSKYKGLVITDDMVKTITKEVATLNNLVKKIEDKRKAIKKDYNTPLSIFETNVKAVTNVISIAVIDLKQQLDVFEQRRKDKVKLQLNDINNKLQVHFNLLPKYLNQVILRDSYFNKTADEKDIIQDMKQQFEILLNQQQLEELKIQQEKERIEREAIERENKIKARCELINKMNAETGCEFKYDTTKHYNDADLILAYQKVITARASVEKMKQDEQQERRIDVTNMNEVDKIVAIHNHQLFNNKKDNHSLFNDKKDNHSLLIENLTKEQLNLIILGLKQKMPLATFKEV